MQELRWYQVCCSPYVSAAFDVRDRAQASTPDGALREVMRRHRFAFVRQASIWQLGRSGAPVVRNDFSCRLPKVGSA